MVSVIAIIHKDHMYKLFDDDQEVSSSKPTDFFLVRDYSLKNKKTMRKELKMGMIVSVEGEERQKTSIVGFLSEGIRTN